MSDEIITRSSINRKNIIRVQTKYDIDEFVKVQRHTAVVTLSFFSIKESCIFFHFLNTKTRNPSLT